MAPSPTEADYESWKKARAAEQANLPVTPENDRQPIPEELAKQIDDLLRGGSHDVILHKFQEKRLQLIELRMLLHTLNLAEAKFQSWFQVLDGLYEQQHVEVSSGTGNLVPYSLGDIGQIIQIISNGIAKDGVSVSSDNQMGNSMGDEMSSDNNLQQGMSSKSKTVTGTKVVNARNSPARKARVRLRPRDAMGHVIPVTKSKESRVDTLRRRDARGLVIQGRKSGSEESGEAVNTRSSRGKGAADVTPVRKRELVNTRSHGKGAADVTPVRNRAPEPRDTRRQSDQDGKSGCNNELRDLRRGKTEKQARRAAEGKKVLSKNLKGTSLKKKQTSEVVQKKAKVPISKKTSRSPAVSPKAAGIISTSRSRMEVQEEERPIHLSNEYLMKQAEGDGLMAEDTAQPNVNLPSHGSDNDLQAHEYDSHSPVHTEHEVGLEQHPLVAEDTARPNANSPSHGSDNDLQAHEYDSHSPAHTEHEVGLEHPPHVEGTPGDDGVFAGWESHGFKFKKDLTSENLRFAAAEGFFSVRFYLCIQKNFMDFDIIDGTERRVEVGIATTTQPIFIEHVRKDCWKVEKYMEEVTHTSEAGVRHILYMNEFSYSVKDRGRRYITRVYYGPDDSRHVIHTLCVGSRPCVLSQSLMGGIASLKDKICAAVSKR